MAWHRGSNITHISNAYPGDVWITFSSSNLEIDRVRLQTAITTIGHGGASVEVELRRVTRTSWMRLSYRSSHRRDRTAKVENVTVVDVNTGEILVFEFQVGQNLSFIITRSGEFQEQERGDPNLWLDWRGENHNTWE